MIRLYAITERPGGALPDEPGVDGNGLLEIAIGGLAAVVGRGAREVAPSVEALWAHEAVVDGLMTERALLPLRFGAVLDDEREAERLVRERRVEFAQALLRVRGRVELGVRAVLAGDARAVDREPTAVRRGDPGSGHAYLAERRAQRDRAAALLDSIHAPLAQLADDSERRVAADTGASLRAAYLVATPRVGDFRATVDGLARDRPDVAVACTGPWPPYSFVGSRDAVAT